MPRRSRKLNLGITGFALVLAALVLAIPVHAEEPTEEKCTSISFMDQGKLTVDRDWLVAQEGSFPLVPVRVYNCSAEEQTVTLSLEGFVPPSTEPVAALLSALLVEHEGEKVQSGKAGDLTLAFSREGLEALTKTATHAGSLVATSRPGADLIRREFELKVEVKEEAAGAKALGLSDLPKALETVTFQGTNYLPSIINPLWPALFWLVAAVLLSLIVWRVLRLSVAGKITTGWARILIGLAVVILLVVGLGVGCVVRTIGLGPQPGLVVVEPISAPEVPETVKSETGDAVATEQAGEGDATEQVAGQAAATPEPTPALVPLGVVAAGDRVGAVGEREGRWEVAGLNRAGTYSGKIDLTPADDDKTKTTFTVNVADWWPFAFFTIALGVVVGYKLTQYYNKGRTAGRVKTEAAALWKQIAAEESRWQAKHAGKTYAGYSMVQAARAQIDVIEASLKAGKVGDDGADGQLKALKTLTGEFDAFRTSTVKLYEMYAELRGLFDKGKFGPEWEDVEAAEHSAVLLEGKALKDIAPFEGGPTFADRDKDVTETIGWVEAVNAALVDVLRWIDFANGLYPGETSWPSDWVAKLGSGTLPAIVKTKRIVIEKEEVTLKSEKQALWRAGRSALTANNIKDVEAQRDAARKAHLNLMALMDAALEEALNKQNIPPANLAQFLAVPALAGVATMREAVGIMTQLAGVEAPRPTVSVDCMVWTLEDKEQKACQGDPDDLFQLTATLTFGTSPAKDYHFRWNFGDGTYSPPISILKNSSPPFEVQARHQYTKGGTYTIRLLEVKDDGTKVSIDPDPGTEVTVYDPPGRSAQRLRSFRLTDTQMTVVSGALAVATGMLALYGPAWGSPKDYFQAFLWGSVVSESAKAGAKIVKGLVDRKWPVPEGG